MEFGVPKERSGREIPERRAPLTPQGVRELVASGHRVYVERGAGEGAGFPDEAYEEAGARLVGREEAFGRPQVVLKVARPTLEEVGLMRKNAVLMAFLHLAVAESPLVEAMAQKGLTAIGYELVGEEGRRPVLRAMSEIAGRMAPQLAGRLLEAPQGPGILLSGLVGIPPADVVVLGAVAVPGERTPLLLTRGLLARMRPGSVLLDFSIDQGGVSETSRPGVYQEMGVTHFCLPNVPALVPRTASHALTATLLPFLLRMEEDPLEVPELRQGAYLLLGQKGGHLE